MLKNLELLISCSQKPSDITRRFEERRKEGINATITCIYFSQMSALIYIIAEYILIELALIYLFNENLPTSIILCHC